MNEHEPEYWPENNLFDPVVNARINYAADPDGNQDKPFELSAEFESQRGQIHRVTISPSVAAKLWVALSGLMQSPSFPKKKALLGQSKLQ